MLCFSVCLIGCAVPALAVEGITDISTSFLAFYTSDGWWYPFTDIPSSITMNGDSWMTTYTTPQCSKRAGSASTYLDFTFNFTESFNANLTNAMIDIYVTNANGSNKRYPANVALTYLYVDGNQVDFSNGLGSALTYEGTVNRSITLRAVRQTALDASFSVTAGSILTLEVRLTGLGSSTGESDDPQVNEIIDQITIQTGYLESIDQNVEDITDSVSNIEVTLTNIDVNISDVKQQLETPSSNIWQAAGQTIKDAVTSLFVPSQQDIQQVKQQFDQLAQDKLGGAYTAMETVDNTVTQVNNKLNNPSAQQGINFPGIAVPLGGDVGTVTIAQPQVVTLPTQLTAILHPVASIIIPIICGLGTFNTMKDIVECFLSGYSYSEYLHRDKGGGDE